ncbi:unnamed protein product [Camellia sinensis]
MARNSPCRSSGRTSRWTIFHPVVRANVPPTPIRPFKLPPIRAITLFPLKSNLSAKKLLILFLNYQVATESNLSAKTATVGVWIDARSRFETDQTNDTAHFLEHMIFKGTKKSTARELEEEIKNIGGHLNAYTSREQTTYYAKVMDNDVPKALDILADILQNSKFDENRITRECDVILREMEQVEGMVIAASGAVKHEDIVEQVKKLFTKLSTDPTTMSKLVAKEPAIFTGSEVRIIDDDIPLAQFAVAFNGASWTDPDSIALMVMQSMLGSWNKNAGGGKHMGSELAQRVGINEIAENMMAFNTNYKDTSLFGVYAIAKSGCLMMRGKLPDEANELLGKMEEEGCSPDFYLYNILVQGFLRNNRTQKGLQFLHVMDDRAIPVDACTATIMVDMLSDDGLDNSLSPQNTPLLPQPKGMVDAVVVPALLSCYGCGCDRPKQFQLCLFLSAFHDPSGAKI